MSWTVAFLPSAQNDLAEAWLQSDDRQAVADAANLIERLLQTDPLLAGESRSGRRRILIEPPLAATLTVSEQDRLVLVTSIVPLQ